MDVHNQRNGMEDKHVVEKMFGSFFLNDNFVKSEKYFVWMRAKMKSDTLLIVVK